MDNGASSYRRFLDGDDSALTQIVADYKDGLILYINGYVRNLHTAEELMEETFFRIIVKRPRFLPNIPLKPGSIQLPGISQSTISRKIPGFSRFQIVNLTQLRTKKLPLPRLIREDRKIAVHRALQKLKPEYRDALFLTYFAQLKNAETAKVMGKSKSQVEMLIYRGKKALKSELEKGGFEYEEL